jgi:hypothetical protein
MVLKIIEIMQYSRLLKTRISGPLGPQFKLLQRACSLHSNVFIFSSTSGGGFAHPTKEFQTPNICYCNEFLRTKKEEKEGGKECSLI